MVMILNIFNNREIASGIWLTIFFLFMLVKKDIRQSLFDVLKAFFHIKILIPLISMIAFVSGTITVLYLIKFWDISLLKDSIIWFCFSGIAIAFNSATSKSSENLFKRNILDNIRIIVFIEFLVNVYTFSLVAELLIMPFMALVVMMGTVAQTDKKYLRVEKLMNGIQMIFGIIVLVYAVGNVISDYKNFGSIDTLKQFLLPFVLSILFMPFVYFLAVFSSYEELLIRLDLGIEKSNELKRYAKRKIFRHCLFSLKKLRVISNMGVYNLMHIQNKDDVNQMINEWNSKERIDSGS
jgi:hypothetical protein